MDDNKEKDLQGEEVSATPENGLTEENVETLSEQEKETVGEILENLKNNDETAAVTDWDGLAEVGGSDNSIIETENEENSVSRQEDETSDGEAELEEDHRCLNCGKRERFTEISEDYPFCKVCRESMKKTHMNFWGVISFIFMVFMGVIAVVWGIYAVATAIPVVKGDVYMSQGKYSSAISCYEEAISSIESLNSETGSEEELFDVGDKTYAKIIRAYCNQGTPTYAQNYYAQLAETGAFDKAKYKDVSTYYDVYEKMIDTYASLQEDYAEELNTLYAAEKKADISEIKDVLASLEKLKSDENLDKYMVAYFQYIYCSVVDNSLDEGIKYLLEIKEGGRAYEFIYAVELCTSYLEKGEYEKAEAECYESLKAAPENIGVYQYLMMSKIRQGDYDAALKLADEAEKLAETIYAGESENAMSYSIPMEEAIAYALKGEEEKALSAIEESYALGNDNSNLNIRILLHYLYHVKGNKTTKDEDGNTVYDAKDQAYDESMSVISYYGSYYGLSVSDNIQAIMDGKKTLEDVFVKGEVNWQ